MQKDIGRRKTMSNEDILRLWNMGLSKMQVVKEYMRQNNKRAKDKKDVDKVTMGQAMRHVEPILFKYEIGRMKN